MFYLWLFVLVFYIIPAIFASIIVIRLSHIELAKDYRYRNMKDYKPNLTIYDGLVAVFTVFCPVLNIAFVKESWSIIKEMLSIPIIRPDK